jgi:hypothetical protein
LRLRASALIGVIEVAKSAAIISIDLTLESSGRLLVRDGVSGTLPGIFRSHHRET